MTEFRYEKKKENINDYLKTVIFKDNLANKALIIALAICLTVIAVAGVIYCIITESMSMIGITVTAVILALVYPLILTFVIKHLTNKLSQSGSEEKDVTIGISESFILLIRNNNPCGKIDWADITEIHEGKIGFYLIEKGGSLLILGSGSVASGTYDEAVQVLRAKKAAITKEA